MAAVQGYGCISSVYISFQVYSLFHFAVCQLLCPAFLLYSFNRVKWCYAIKNCACMCVRPSQKRHYIDFLCNGSSNIFALSVTITEYSRLNLLAPNNLSFYNGPLMAGVKYVNKKPRYDFVHNGKSNVCSRDVHGLSLTFSAGKGQM